MGDDDDDEDNDDDDNDDDDLDDAILMDGMVAMANGTMVLLMVRWRLTTTEAKV